MEAELKIEQLAQVVALASGFQAESLRPLIERSALAKDGRRQLLFIINATTPAARLEAQFLIHLVRPLDLFFIISS